MPNLNPIDQQLLSIVTVAPPATIPEVVAVMENIDALLPGNDGLKWFNQLYLMVTRAIDFAPSTQWVDAAWVTRLDVVFAGLYFRAIAEFLNQNPATPGSWDALLESRNKTDIDRIQFALCGMNAHINHDLALALLATNVEMKLRPTLQSPEHTDYQHVNNILAQVLPNALNVLATGTLGGLAQDTGKIGRLLAIWDVGIARDGAWAFADHLSSLPAVAHPAALAIQDKVTGLAGRALLLPIR